MNICDSRAIICQREGINDLFSASFGLNCQKRLFWVKLKFHKKFEGQIEPYSNDQFHDYFDTCLTFQP